MHRGLQYTLISSQTARLFLDYNFLYFMDYQLKVSFGLLLLPVESRQAAWCPSRFYIWSLFLSDKFLSWYSIQWLFSIRILSLKMRVRLLLSSLAYRNCFTCNIALELWDKATAPKTLLVWTPWKCCRVKDEAQHLHDVTLSPCSWGDKIIFLSSLHRLIMHGFMLTI